MTFEPESITNAGRRSLLSRSFFQRFFLPKHRVGFEHLEEIRLTANINVAHTKPSSKNDGITKSREADHLPMQFQWVAGRASDG